MEKYNRLSVIEIYTKTKPNGKKAKYAWCRCECGVEKEIELYRVRNGVTKSCGCISREITIERNTTHGLRNNPIYNTYNSMMARCYNSNHKNFKHYGNRGIKVEKEWHDIFTFVSWCEENGFRKNLQLDRVDNNKNYGPDNCRFVTPTVNLRNTRRNVFIEGKALREYLEDLGRKYNLSFPTLRYRYYTIKKENLVINEENLIYDNRWIKKVTSRSITTPDAKASEGLTTR